MASSSMIIEGMGGDLRFLNEGGDIVLVSFNLNPFQGTQSCILAMHASSFAEFAVEPLNIP